MGVTKKKFTEKIFLEELKTNSKDNPFDISDYDKQSVLDYRKNNLRKDDIFYVTFKCNECNEQTNKNLRYAKDILFLTICGKCRTIHTCLEKYNVEYYAQTDISKKKHRETSLKKYGETSPTKSEVIKAKIRATNIKRYGSACVLQVKQVREKAKETMLKKYGKEHNSQIEFVKEQKKKTCLEHYGKEHPLQVPEIMLKAKKTNKERYGTEYATQSDIVRNKIEQTNIDKYGNKCSLHGKNQEKTEQAFIEKYGVDNPYKSQEVIDKIKDTKIERYGSVNCTHLYQYNNLYFDSSWELAFYIYHVDHNHNIIREPKYFEYACNKTIHRYYPDFKVGNKYYEIKGEQFIKRNKNGNIIGFVHFGENNAQANAKYKCIIEHNINIIDYNKIQKYLRYITKTYGNNYLEQFVTTEKYGDKNDNQYNEE